MNILIKRLEQKDREIAIQSVSQFRESPPDQMSVARFLANRHNIFLTASLDGILVGQLIGYKLDRWDGQAPMLFLYSIDVAERYQRQGVGSLLIETFQGIGREEGCGELFLLTNESNTPAMMLYQQTGGERPHQDDVMFIYRL